MLDLLRAGEVGRRSRSFSSLCGDPLSLGEWEHPGDLAIIVNEVCLGGLLGLLGKHCRIMARQQGGDAIIFFLFDNLSGFLSSLKVNQSVGVDDTGFAQELDLELLTDESDSFLIGEPFVIIEIHQAVDFLLPAL